MKKVLLGVCSALVMTACSTPAPQDDGVAARIHVPAKSAPLVSGIDLSDADSSVRPQDDLYQAVDGEWLKKTEIPADKSNYGAFTKLTDDAEAQLRGIIE